MPSVDFSLPYNPRGTMFGILIWKLFNHHPRLESNLINVQEKLFERLQNDGNTLVVDDNKGLGPVSVALSKYINAGLVHLQNEYIHRIISEEDVL